MPVYYNYSVVGFEFENEESITSWIREVIGKENKKLGEIVLIIVSDEEILRINRLHLNHNYFTDVITFPDNRKNRISGDIFISIDTVKKNANDLKLPFMYELLRVIIHGVLHLLGYADLSDSEKNIMRKLEDKYLILYPMF